MIYTRKSNIMLTMSLYLLMVVYAISVTMVGPLMSILISHYTLRFSQGGLIVAFQNIGGILSIALGAVLADRIKKSVIIASAYALYGISLFSISHAPSYGLLLGLFFILGASTRMVDSVVNAFIADLNPQKRGYFLNLLHGFFAIGALLGPIFSQHVVGKGVGWNRAFWALGIVCSVVLLVYIIVLKLFPPVYTNKTQSKSIDFSGVIKSSVMWVLCLIIIMYSAHQSGINTWWVMFMENFIETSKVISSLSLSIFWIGIILGRFTCSYLIRYIKPRYILVTGNLSGGFILTISILVKVPDLLIVAIGLAGFLTGAVIPILVTIACNWYPQNSGTASSMLFFSSSLANIFSPWFIGLLTENAGFQWGIIITGISLLVGFFFSLLVPAREKQ